MTPRSIDPVRAALAGEFPLSQLTDAEVQAAIEHFLARVDFAKMHTARGITTVAIDQAGRKIPYAPGGTTTILQYVDGRTASIPVASVNGDAAAARSPEN